MWTGLTEEDARSMALRSLPHTVNTSKNQSVTGYEMLLNIPGVPKVGVGTPSGVPT